MTKQALNKEDSRLVNDMMNKFDKFELENLSTTFAGLLWAGTSRPIIA